MKIENISMLVFTDKIFTNEGTIDIEYIKNT
jgi:hypothetical protein